MLFVSGFLSKRGVHFSPKRLFTTPGVISEPRKAILPLSVDGLGKIVQGSGRAKMIWQQLRTKGLDPLDRASESSQAVKLLLQRYMQGERIIPASIDSEVSSPCGTKKLLLKLRDGQSIETVIIPMGNNDHCTVCVSTQLGCDRRCTFCATGTMGLIRCLTSSEIIAQVLIAQQVIQRDGMPPLTNVVYMGMGDAGGNVKAVRESVECLTDDYRMHLSPNRICVSTVGPRPEVFMELASMPAMLAWSLHSPVEETRKKLVPSARFTPTELRDGLIIALLSRPNPKHRSVMITFTLIDGINDSLEEAERIIEFLRPLKDVAARIVVNLLPYNDITSEGLPVGKVSPFALSFARPSDAAVTAMRLRIMQEEGLLCYTRDTRGEQEAAACGMLVTKRIKREELHRLEEEEKEKEEKEKGITEGGDRHQQRPSWQGTAQLETTQLLPSPGSLQFPQSHCSSTSCPEASLRAPRPTDKRTKQPYIPGKNDEKRHKLDNGLSLSDFYI